MIGLGVFLMMLATPILLFGKAAGLAAILYVIGLFLMFRGESNEGRKLILDRYGVRKANENPTKADYARVENEERLAAEERREKANALSYKAKRKQIDASVNPLSYSVKYSQPRNGWIAVSNDWLTIEAGLDSEIEEFDRYSEDHAVIRLHERMAKLKTDGLLKSWQP